MSYLSYFTRKAFWITTGIVFVLIVASGWEQYGTTSLITGAVGGGVVATVLTFLWDQFHGWGG